MSAKRERVSPKRPAKNFAPAARCGRDARGPSRELPLISAGASRLQTRVLVLAFHFAKEETRMDYFLDWHDHAGSQPEKFYKTTLWQGERVMVGLNCLEPGQTQKTHA